MDSQYTVKSVGGMWYVEKSGVPVAAFYEIDGETGRAFTNAMEFIKAAEKIDKARSKK